MKKLLIILFICCSGFNAIAQTDTNEAKTAVDTTLPLLPKPVLKPVKKHPAIDSFKKRITPDTTKINDSISKADSIVHLTANTPKIPAITPTIKRPVDSFYLKLLNNPFLKTTAKPAYLVINEREPHSKDEIFYLLLGLLLFLAFIKLVFSRYFRNLFRLFFQATFRQKQTREQLLQSNLPSLLLNLFFIFSGAAYISFLLQYYELENIGFWYILLVSASALLILYLSKFIFLSFAGWVFNVKEATDSYIFSVYLINKIIGVTLIPFIFLIAFSQPLIINVSVTVSILLISLLFIYRYFVSYNSVRREVRVNIMHFFFYIIAFEITPLLLIYKTLIIYLHKSL